MRPTVSRHYSFVSPPYHNQPVGTRKYAASDTELSLPSVRLHRSPLHSFGYSGGYPASGHVTASTPPHLAFWTYSSAPPPSAPPALHYSVSPYARIPLPSQSNVPGPIFLHPLLRLTSTLDINLSSPEAIQAALGIATAEIFSPATQPPLPSMTIMHPLIPWYMTVHRSVSEHVTVLDVLDTICRELNKRIRTNEGQHYGGLEGRRRVGLLQGSYRFRGLTEAPRGEDVWELITS